MSNREPARDPDPEQGFRAEHYFPLNYLDTPFRRRPFAGMSYRGAIEAALAELWNIGHPPDPSDMDKAMMQGADIAHEKLHYIYKRFSIPNPEHPNRSQALVHDFVNLWRGPVSVVLEWFRKTEGA